MPCSLKFKNARNRYQLYINSEDLDAPQSTVSTASIGLELYHQGVHTRAKKNKKHTFKNSYLVRRALGCQITKPFI